MELGEFFQHHGLRPDARPFDNSDDAKSDTVFAHIQDYSRHQDWNRFFGEAGVPSTAVIFGKKGSGKTALRLQMKQTVARYNEGREDGRVMVVDYGDFNPFISAFQTHLDARARRGLRKLIKAGASPDLFAAWRMSDHLDAILSLAVTQYVTELLADGQTPPDFTSVQRQTLVFLTLLYDQAVREGQPDRVTRLAERLGLFTFANAFSRKWDRLFHVSGWRVGVDNAGGALAALLSLYGAISVGAPALLLGAPAALLLGHLPGWTKRRRRNAAARRSLDATAVLSSGPRAVEGVQQGFHALPGSDFKAFEPPSSSLGAEQAMTQVEENRYAYLKAFQEIIARSGYSGLLIIVDQVDEPTLMQGEPKRMWAFIRSLLDNKLLQHPGMGIKFLLLEELYGRYEKEEDDFRARARLDKQNVVKSLKWTGANLLDLANRRLAACATDAARPPRIESLFDESLRDRLMAEFARWENPRTLFKFLDATIKLHVERHPAHNPVWTINETSLETAAFRCTGGGI